MTTISAVKIGPKAKVLTLTNAAVTKAGELIRETGTDGLVLRVAVKPGGCSGLSFDMFFDESSTDDDTKIVYGDLTVVVDSDSAPLISGSTLDYTDGLSGAGFHVTNPNATRTCGCGNSFS